MRVSMTTRTAAWSAAPRTNSAGSSPKRANGSYTVMLSCAVCPASNATMVRVMLSGVQIGRRYADLLHEDGTKPSEVAGAQAGGKLDGLAYRLECVRPQPGRWGVPAPEQVWVAERAVDGRDYLPQQLPRIAGIADGRDGARQLRPAVLVVQAEERQTEQQVQIIAVERVTADPGSEHLE